MTKEEWLREASGAKDKLASLIDHYHPANRLPGGTDLPITAHNAERACVHVRSEIRKNFEGNPREQFFTALDEEDTDKISNLLNDTWFGVPESTLCWQIPGFREAVKLITDPPDGYVEDE